MSDENIKGLKLMNGAEVVADILNTNGDSFQLKNAVFWDLVRVGEEKYDVQFFPMTNGAKMEPNATHFGLDVTIQKSAVLFEYELRAEIEAKYRQFISPILLLNK